MPGALDERAIFKTHNIAFGRDFHGLSSGV